jgi:hypothetical protein
MYGESHWGDGFDTAQQLCASSQYAKILRASIDPKPIVVRGFLLDGSAPTSGTDDALEDRTSVGFDAE